ncbi:MAG: hypothetical protein DRO88_06040 [Promethearchaeia archaeon]|nr:MAG: hypothetical protein DRO88_06040 [Candidatus Lokiarchaeia archaeon]
MNLLEYLKNHNIHLISFIGYSHSGKTASIESIITAAKNRDFHCIVLKKTNHSLPIFDTPSKDTWKYSQNGASMVIGRTKVEVATFLNKNLTEPQFDQFSIGLIQNYQNIFPQERILVMCEGFRNISSFQVLCAESVEDIEKQINPNVVAIAGKITSNNEFLAKISHDFHIPIINCLIEPEKLLKQLNI